MLGDLPMSAKREVGLNEGGGLYEYCTLQRYIRSILWLSIHAGGEGNHSLDAGRPSFITLALPVIASKG